MKPANTRADQSQAKGGSGLKRGSGSRNPSAAGVRWVDLADPSNERSDSAHKRYYKLETLARAVEKHLSMNDSLIGPALRVRGFDERPAGLTFRLIGETQTDLRFAVAVLTPARKRVSLVLFAAKNADECTTQLRRRWRALCHAHERAPELTLRPLSSAKLFLPDRHQRKGLGREIFCYLTDTAEMAYTLSVGRDNRLCTFEPGPKMLSARDEAAMRMQLVILACRMYDPKEQIGLILPDLARSQFLLRRHSGHRFELVVVAPDGLRTRLTVPRFVHELVTWNAGAGVHRLRICPDTTAEVLTALRSAVGEPVARDWLARYKRSVVARKLAAVAPVTPGELMQAGIE